MIRLNEDLYTADPRRKRVAPAATKNSWREVEQRLQQWVRTRPAAALILAVGVGAALALAIKRRT